MSETAVATHIDEAEAGFREAVNRAYEFTDGLSNPRTREEYRWDIFGCRYPRGECKHESPERHYPFAFLPWCARWGINPMSVSKAELKRWVAELGGSGYAPGTQARQVSSVSSFYESLFADEILDVNPAHRLRAKEKPQRRTPGTAGRALSDGQAMALLDAAEADGQMPERSVLLVALMMYVGMRVTEAITVCIEDYVVGDKGPQITYRVKGGGTLVKSLDEYVDSKVRAWLAVRPEGAQLPALQAGARAKRTLLCTEAGAPMSRQTAYRLIRRLAGAAGIPGTVSPHDLRRTFASLSIEEGTTIRDLQKAMGHKKSETTESYDRSALSPDRSPAHILARRHARLRDELGCDVEQGGLDGPPLSERVEPDAEAFDPVSGY